MATPMATPESHPGETAEYCPYENGTIAELRDTGWSNVYLTPQRPHRYVAIVNAQNLVTTWDGMVNEIARLKAELHQRDEAIASLLTALSGLGGTP